MGLSQEKLCWGLGPLGTPFLGPFLGIAWLIAVADWKNKEERANVRDTNALSSFITAVGS